MQTKHPLVVDAVYPVPLKAGAVTEGSSLANSLLPSLSRFLLLLVCVGCVLAGVCSLLLCGGIYLYTCEKLDV